MNPTITELEERIAGLRRELQQTEAAIPPIEAQLAPAEAKLAAAQAEYNESIQLWGKAQAAGSGSPLMHRERSAADLERSAALERDAHQAFQAAEEALSKALVARNSLNVQRSNLRMHARMLGGRIEQDEAALLGARVAAERQAQDGRGLLDRVRASLGGRGGLFGCSAAS